MKGNLCQVISLIASFIGANLTDKVVTRADMTSFKKMKDHNTANMSWAGLFNDGGFMRKGEVGNWRKTILTA